LQIGKKIDREREVQGLGVICLGVLVDWPHDENRKAPKKGCMGKKCQLAEELRPKKNATCGHARTWYNKNNLINNQTSEENR